MVYPLDEGYDEVSYHKDDDAELYRDPTWYASGLYPLTPWGLRSTMKWIKSHYPGVDVYVTENGVSDMVSFFLSLSFIVSSGFCTIIHEAIK